MWVLRVEIGSWAGIASFLNSAVSLALRLHSKALVSPLRKSLQRKNTVWPCSLTFPCQRQVH